MKATKLANWKELAAEAWAACDDRKLTQQEKLALAIEAVSGARDKSFLRVSTLAARTPLSCAELRTVLRCGMGSVNATLGLDLAYNRGYHGNGGRRWKYHEASLA